MTTPEIILSAGLILVGLLLVAGAVYAACGEDEI